VPRLSQTPPPMEEGSDRGSSLPAIAAPSPSLAGGASLVAGCAIGAGMLALPVETAAAGYAPSEVSLLVCYLFTNISSLLVLEGSKAALTRAKASGDDSVQLSFLSMAESALGKQARWLTAGLYIFVQTALTTAYIAGVGDVLSSDALPFGLTPVSASALFAAVFGGLLVAGANACEVVNRGLVVGLVASFGMMISRGVSSIQPETLTHMANWGSIFPGGLSVAMVAFLSQSTVPTVLQYFNGNVRKTRQAILLGNIVPLAVYTIWEAVALSAVPYSPDMSRSPADFLVALGQAIGGSNFYLASVCFSVCALTSSFLGVGLGLVDCLVDLFPGGKSALRARMGVGVPLVGISLYFAVCFKDAFAVILENVGLLAALALFGVLPSLVVLQTRKEALDMKGWMQMSRLKAQTPGGKTTIAGMIATSVSLIVPEMSRLLTEFASIF